MKAHILLRRVKSRFTNGQHGGLRANLGQHYRKVLYAYLEWRFVFLSIIFYNYKKQNRAYALDSLHVLFIIKFTVAFLSLPVFYTL